jgi:hypothetical protein
VEVNGGVERHVVMNDKLGLVSEMTLTKNMTENEAYLDIVSLINSQLRTRELIIHEDHLSGIAIRRSLLPSEVQVKVDTLCPCQGHKPRAGQG